MDRVHISLVVIINCILLSGCAVRSHTSVYTPPSEVSRNPLQAQSLTQQAAALMDEDPEKAEHLLRQALAADLHYGPAHNNLGVLMLQHEQLYEAAHEFEWARKLMPGHPDPRMNLALTLERAGRFKNAAEEYRAALAVYPDHLPTVQALARLQVRHGLVNDETVGYLDAIALQSETQEWREWARHARLQFQD